MRIGKGKSVLKLKTPLYQLTDVACRVNGHWERLNIVSVHDIERMMKTLRITGPPRSAAIDNLQSLLVWPCPDRRYDIEVIGTVLVRQ